MHPLPEDVIGAEFRTSEIVHHIRCEARAAIKSAIVDYFRHTKKPELMAIAGRLQSGELPFEEFTRGLGELAQPARDNIIKYRGAAITYDFTFDITEQNTLSGEADIVHLFSRGVLSVGPRGTGDLQRQTVRIFRANDTFHELMLFPSRRCTDDGSPENLLYPVSGTIGLAEMIKTFVDLNQFQKLTGKEDKVPTLTDTFKFQTTFSGSVGPQVTLAPLGQRTYLAGGSLTASAMRKDIHQVIVALALPPPPNGPPPSTGLFGGAPLRAPATATEQSNAAADGAIQRSIINKLGNSP
ncbi:hypothetical protein [Rhodopseudomonas telluris]|uniref:Uncharacterized protein n=1 Tax=Rhodopseudomonas telluris TaxID=644215 RepID=A0ABV6EXG7_9BRAD